MIANPSQEGSLALFYLCSILPSAILCYVSFQHPLVQLFGINLAWILAIFVTFYYADKHKLERLTLQNILFAAILIRLVAAQATPLLEDDYYRYIWDGFQSASLINPYLSPPAEFFDNLQLSEQWQNILLNINYPEVPTIYGPVLQYIFALAYFFEPGDIKSLQYLFFMLDVVILSTFAIMKGHKLALLIYSLHPVVIKEGIASAHPDFIVGGLILFAVLAWKNCKPLLLGTLLALAIATKISAFIALPLFFIPPDRQLISWWANVIISFSFVILALYLPFILTGATEVTALKTLSINWKFNAMVYPIFDHIFGELGRYVSFICLLAIIGLIVITWIWKRKQALPPVDLALIFLMLFSPVVNPWYAMWLIPAALYLKRYVLAAATAILSLAYFNTTVLFDAGLIVLGENESLFVVHWASTIMQVTVIILAIAYELTKNKWHEKHNQTEDAKYHLNDSGKIYHV